MTATELAARWLDVASGGNRDVRNRLERGRAGAGRLTDVLQPVPGGLEVRVPDGRGRSHDVTLAIAPIAGTVNLMFAVLGFAVMLV